MVVVGCALSMQGVQCADNEYETRHAFSFKSVIFSTRDASLDGIGERIAELVETLDQRL